MQIFIKYIRVLNRNGLFHILSGSFLTKIVSFFGSIFIVRILTKQDYGILGYLENIYGYVLTVAGMGLSNALLRYVILGKNINEKYSYFHYIVCQGILWNIILIIVTGILFVFYPHPAEYENYKWLLFILLIALPFQYLTDNTFCNERAMFANRRYATFSFILSTAIIGSKILAGYWGGLYAVIFCQTVVYIALGIMYIKTTKKKYYLNASAYALTKKEKRQISSYSLQYMLTNGLWALFMLNDTFLLGRYCTPEAIADYRVAYAIPGSISIISTAIGICVSPYFVKNENNTRWIQIKFKNIYCSIAVILAVICLTISSLATPIIYILYGKEYINIVSIMRRLLIASFFNCGLRYTTANILASMGKIKYNMTISIIGIVCQFGLNLKIAPIYGTIGVATTSCIVYGMMAVCLLIIFVNQYYVKK